MIRNGGRYASLILGAGALWWLAHQGVFPERNPLRPNEYLVWERDLNRHQWSDLFNRRDVIIGLTFFFVTVGPTATLPNDFNINSNKINCIGNGAGGAPGTGGAPGGGADGTGGSGGGAGAFAQILNYSAHGAGAVVNVNFSGNVWFDTSTTVLAQSASGAIGGTAAGSIGTTTSDGGSGGSAVGIGFNAAGGGGGAGGPHGAGSNGANGGASFGQFGVGGTADAGNTPADSNGTQFDATHGCAGGGDGGAGGVSGSGGNGGNGSNAGFYGAGGGGGGGGGGNAGMGAGGNGGNGGNGTQGLIAISYTPSTGTGRSFAILLT